MPLRLVSMTKGLLPIFSDSFLPNSVETAVVWKLETLSEKPSASAIPARWSGWYRASGDCQPALPASR